MGAGMFAGSLSHQALTVRCFTSRASADPQWFRIQWLAHAQYLGVHDTPTIRKIHRSILVILIASLPVIVLVLAPPRRKRWVTLIACWGLLYVCLNCTIRKRRLGRDNLKDEIWAVNWFVVGNLFYVPRGEFCNDSPPLSGCRCASSPILLANNVRLLSLYSHNWRRDSNNGL